MERTRKPHWLLIVLAVIGAMVVIPPLLVLAFGALGLVIGLAATVLKVAIALAVIWALVQVCKGIFGSPSQPRLAEAAVRTEEPIDAINAALEREDREKLAALDRELELAVRKPNAGT